MWQYMFFFVCLFCVCGCEKCYLSILRERVDRSTLASTFVSSPDPRQHHPPIGQRLMIEWFLSSSLFKQELMLQLKVIYNNHSQKTLFYPINCRWGMVLYSLLDEEYHKSKGILTYKVEIQTLEGNVVKQWKQRLWVDLIDVEDEEVEEISSQ